MTSISHCPRYQRRTKQSPPEPRELHHWSGKVGFVCLTYQGPRGRAGSSNVSIVLPLPVLRSVQCETARQLGRGRRSRPHRGNAAPVVWLVGRGLFCGQNIVLYSVSYMVDIPAWDCQVFFNIRASIVGCRHVPFSRTCKSMVDDYPMTYHVFILELRKQ